MNHSDNKPTVTAASSPTETPNIPVRILNEFVYCPRLAYLEWVQKEWVDNLDTVQGSYAHRRVDQRAGPLPAAKHLTEDSRVHARSVDLEAPELGIVAKLDLIESEGDVVTPVDYKKSKRPHTSTGAFDPERVQLCAQGLILEANGYKTKEGVLYFVGSRERVRVPFDDELRQLTFDSIKDLRSAVASAQLPPPLDSSPKCGRCSLVSVCMPDEVNHQKLKPEDVRPIAVPKTRALPAYVQANGARVTKAGDCLEVIPLEGEKTTLRLGEVSQLVLQGNVSVSAPVVHELLRRNIPVVWSSYGGWYLGHSASFASGNIELRIAQFRSAADPAICLQLAKGLTIAKIQNCRTLLMRNWRHGDGKEQAARQLQKLCDQVDSIGSIESLLGVEGAAAAEYFGAFNRMLNQGDELGSDFRLEGRNRRPPTDRVNAVLSFVYSMLTRQFSVALATTGFDEMMGFYHQPRFGRPALALDLMEPFRPLISDSVCLTVINNGEICPGDFAHMGNAVNLNESGRKAVIRAFERRLDQEVTHPLFGYRLSYRRLIEVQCRLLARYLLNDIPEYPNFLTR